MRSVPGSLEPLRYEGQYWDTQDGTPLILPIRGCLEDVKAMMKGDHYIGRGCRQRDLPRGPFCNNYRVGKCGRQAAIELFETHLTTVPQLMDQFWTVSGCRLLCHCRANQACHGDITILHFRSRYPTAHNRTDRHVQSAQDRCTDLHGQLARGA